MESMYTVVVSDPSTSSNSTLNNSMNLKVDLDPAKTLP